MEQLGQQQYAIYKEYGSTLVRRPERLTVPTLLSTTSLVKIFVQLSPNLPITPILEGKTYYSPMLLQTKPRTCATPKIIGSAVLHRYRCWKRAKDVQPTKHPYIPKK